MKLFINSFILIFSFNLLAETICAPSYSDGGSSELCIPIENERMCNEQGQNGLACFWINYGDEQAGGGCSSAVVGYENHCSQILDGNICSVDSKCSWAGVNSEMPDYEEDQTESPSGMCGASSGSHIVRVTYSSGGIALFDLIILSSLRYFNNC